MSWISQPLQPLQAGIVLVGFGTVNWNRSAQPLASPSIDFGINIDGNNAVSNTLNSFNLGLFIVPQAGATGAIAFTAATAPSSSPVFTAFDNLNSTQPSLGVTAVTGINSGGVDFVLTGPRNLFGIQLTTANSAVGRFDIFAVPEFSNYFSTTQFDGLKYGNAPTGPNVLLGTIFVTAVPEPGSILFLAIAIAWLGSVRLGRRWQQSIPIQIASKSP